MSINNNYDKWLTATIMQPNIEWDNVMRLWQKEGSAHCIFLPESTW